MPRAAMASKDVPRTVPYTSTEALRAANAESIDARREP